MPVPHLSADLWHQIQTTVQSDYRVRFERRLDKDFQESANDNRSDLHQRVRVGVNWKLNDKVSGLLQYQYAHTVYWSKAKNASDENSDLFQAYAQLKEPSGTVTLGRQRINLGSERLIGSLEWVNAGRSFDGIRFENKAWDVFGARIGVQNVRPRNVRLGAISHKHALGATSLIYKHDEIPAGDLDVFTLAHAYKQKFSNFELEAEGAVQTGSVPGKDLEAWALHAQLNLPVGKTAKLSLEFNGASGGGTANTTRTFDNLYPTNHKFYGLMDLHAWKNVDMLAVHYSVSPRPELDLKARFASSRLHDAKDAWYGASGLPNRFSSGPFVDPTGNSGKEIGQEFDFEAVWRRNPKQTLTAGVGVFVPGEFVKNLSGDNQKQIFGFVMLNVKL